MHYHGDEARFTSPEMDNSSKRIILRWHVLRADFSAGKSKGAKDFHQICIQHQLCWNIKCRVVGKYNGTPWRIPDTNILMMNSLFLSRWIMEKKEKRYLKNHPVRLLVMFASRLIISNASKKDEAWLIIFLSNWFEYCLLLIVVFLNNFWKNDCFNLASDGLF